MSELTEMPYSYINRTLCGVLDDMRGCYKTRNFSALMGLIEEAQLMGNRMEAALEDQDDIANLVEAKSKIKKEVEDLIVERDKMDTLLKPGRIPRNTKKAEKNPLDGFPLTHDSPRE